MSDTPRTDALIESATRDPLDFRFNQVWELARELEREVAALREQLNAARTDYWEIRTAIDQIAYRAALKGKP